MFLHVHRLSVPKNKDQGLTNRREGYASARDLDRQNRATGVEHKHSKLTVMTLLQGSWNTVVITTGQPRIIVPRVFISTNLKSSPCRREEAE